MSRLRLLPTSIVIFLLPACPALAQTPPTTVQSDETDLNKLAAVLRSDAPYAQKLLACKRLARLGTKDSVPALAPLLVDPKLSHAARLALEAIPDPAAGDALREAIVRVKGQQLVGVVNSLGVRRDTQAVTPLERLLADRDPVVAAAAAGALGKIGTPATAAILERTLATAPPTVRNAVADACLDCAERLRSTGKSAAAAAIFDHVAKADLPAPVRAAALRGEILVQEPAGGARLAAQLQSTDKALFAMALIVTREMPHAGVTQILLAQLPKLSPERQSLVIAALGDRADVAARPAVVQAAGSADPIVRVAAIRALATLGDPSVLPLLLAAAAQADQDIADAALDTLAVLPGSDAPIASLLETATGKSRLILLDLVGRRQIAAALPALLKAVDAPDPQTRLAALTALGGTIDPKHFPILTKRLLATGSPQEQAAAQGALKAACARLPDKQSCAEVLATCLPQASPDATCFLLELLGTVGGPTALKAVSVAAMNPNEEIQDAATRLLGDWNTPDAAAALGEVARKSPSAKFRVRALRGYIRVARQMDLPLAEKIAICREALTLAQRDEERVLALEALGRFPSTEALDLVTARLRLGPLKAAASAAAVSIAEKTVASHPRQVRDAMKQVLEAAPDKTLTRRAKDLLLQAEPNAAKHP